jgi:hypothetical protein
MQVFGGVLLIFMLSGDSGRLFRVHDMAESISNELNELYIVPIMYDDNQSSTSTSVPIDIQLPTDQKHLQVGDF